VIRNIKNNWTALFGSLALLLPFQLQTQESTDLLIGPPLKGAWHSSAMPGQGFIMDVISDPDVIFVGWFTYPRDSEVFSMDPVSHRWYTIQGEYSGSKADTVIYQTTGGSFLGSSPVETSRIGTAAFRFTGCNTAEFDYRFDDSGESGIIAISRVASIDESACDSLIPDPPVPDQIGADLTTVLMNVNVIDMPSGDIHSGQMVVVRGGVIVRVGDHNPDLIPAGAVVIDGTSRYLLPGMVDTHTHLATNVREFLGLRVSSTQVEESARNQLVLYLTRGVTTILNNGDFGEPLPRWGAEVESGMLTGPTIYAAQYARGDSSTSDGGPDNRAVTSAGQARGFTRDSLAAGYQFMKVYNHTPRDAVLAILDEARGLGMPVLGHLPQTLSTSETLDNGLDMVAHSGAYLWKFFGNDVRASNSRIAQAVQMSLVNGTAVTATLGIEELIDQIWCNDPQGVDAYWSREETRYMHSTTASLNDRSINAKWRWNPDGCSIGGYVGVRNFLRKFTRALHEGGVMVMMGTDSPTVLGVPGFSAIDEVRALVNSGIPLSDAIRIATWNGGDFISTRLELDVPFGAIREGWRADLLLLGSNPLESADHLEDIVGVMARGRWKSRSWFDEQLELIAESYGN
jgi:imidazolonepropionase-like amidohydrolase